MTVRRLRLVALKLIVVVLIALAAGACGAPWSKPATSNVGPGGDDSKALTDALSNVKDGDTIKLAAGTYRLSQPLQIVKSVNIVGTGKTTVQCAAGDYVVAFGSGCKCTVTGVAFLHTGAGVGDAVYDSGSRVDFTDCRFAGGVPGGHKGGMGLSFGEGASGTMLNCQVTGNKSLGVFVNSSAGVAVDGCTIRRNGTGIGVMNGSLVATGNTVTGNKLGIYVIEHSQAKLIGNTCSQDRLGGIRVEGTSTVTARDIKCFDDTMSGILIAGSARATLVHNSTEGSIEGITFAGRASGSATSNHCADRIYVMKGLQVKLSHNWQPAFYAPGIGDVKFD
jgi:parallel beta-helix repeat protein